jgi:hypothetical protein
MQAKTGWTRVEQVTRHVRVGQVAGGDELQHLHRVGEVPGANTPPVQRRVVWADHSDAMQSQHALHARAAGDQVRDTLQR